MTRNRTNTTATLYFADGGSNNYDVPQEIIDDYLTNSDQNIRYVVYNDGDKTQDVIPKSNITRMVLTTTRNKLKSIYKDGN